MVDFLRNYQPAEEWLSRQQDLGVTPIVWLEGLQVSPNKNAHIKATKLLKVYERVPLDDSDFELAIRNALLYTLSHNVSAFDCLVAASSARLNAALHTFSINNFLPLL